MTRIQPIDGFVLNAVLSDAEDLDDIVAHVNGPESEWVERFERPAQRAEVLASLMRLVKERALEVIVPSADESGYQSCGEGVWPDLPTSQLTFNLTGRGQVRLLIWDT